MQASDDLHQATETTAPIERPAGFGNELKSLLEDAYGVRFSILDAATGETIDSSPEQPPCDWASRLDLCQTVVRRGTPEFLDDEDPLVTLALPATDAQGNATLAVATLLTTARWPRTRIFPTRPDRWGISSDAVLQWARSRKPCRADVLQQITTLVFQRARARDRLQAIGAEAGRLSINLASTYEELDLLHRLTERA